MAYIDQATKRTATLVAAIETDSTIPAPTKVAMGRYMDFMKARGLSDNTIAKNLYCISTFLKAIGGKDLMKLTKDDIMMAMGKVEGSAYSPKTKQNIKVSVKALYKHLLGEDEFYPPIIRWISTGLKESKRVMPEDILTEEDVLKILDAGKTERDKALISMLFDSGVRVGELLNMKIKDVDLDSNPAHIVVTGKTGMRRIPILFSVPYVADYLNKAKATRRPVDYLWERYGKWAPANKALDRAGVAIMLKMAAARAGIEKPINPHAWRHARATYYANRLTEQQLKMFFVWTGGSKMAATYVHLSGRDLDNGVLQANGQKVQELQQPKLQAKVCPRCRTTNGAEMMYCGRCGSAMSIEVAMAQDKRNDVYAEMSRNPEVLKIMAREKRKQKRESPSPT